MPERAASQDELAVARGLEGVINYLRESRQPHGMSASALSVLSRLQSGGPMRITDLSEREGLSQPGMTTLVNRLVEAGAATRNQDPADGRAVLVTITPSGAKHVIAYRAFRTELVATRVRRLSEDDRRALIAALPALEHLTTE